MKKFYRYMSEKEFALLTAGCDIKKTNRCSHCRTTSEGVCFLSEKTIFTTYCCKYDEKTGEEIPEEITFNPIACYRFLEGIVSKDVLVEFETEIELYENYGIYADPFGIYDETIVINEYCIDYYNRDIMRPTRYCCNFQAYGVEPIWYNCNL